jgi:hypothetical protein
MKKLKFLGLAVVAVAAMMALVGAASASAAETTLCKTNETPCKAANHYPIGTEIKAKLKSGTKAKLAAGFFTFECSGSEVIGKTETTGEPSGKITTLSFTGCNNEETKVLKNGSLKVKNIAGTMNGNLSVSGVSVTVREFGEDCVFGGNITSGITINGGSPASVKANASIPRESGSFLCGNPSTWTAEYEVTTPNPLWIAES